MPVTVQVVASRPKSLQPDAVAQSNLQLATGAQPNLQIAAKAQPRLQAAADPQPNLQPAAGAQPSLLSVTILQELHDEADIAISAEEMDAFLQELDEDEAKVVVKKKRRLNASEKTKLWSVVADVDRKSLHAAIVESISGMVHISAIEERRLFWEHTKTSECFTKVCNHFVSEYIRLHKQCDKGADKYAVFYLNWYEQIQSISTTSEYLSTCRGELTKSYNNTVTEDMWTTLVTTILHASFNAMQTIMSHHIPLTHAGHVHSIASVMSEDDDVALLRLGGWALFSCIQYRKKALKGKSKIKHTSKKLKAYKTELNILEALVDDKKVGLPSAITAQDRGYMTFPCPSMMPFVKELNKKIKECINPLSYATHGSKLFDVSHRFTAQIHA